MCYYINVTPICTHYFVHIRYWGRRLLIWYMVIINMVYCWGSKRVIINMVYCHMYSWLVSEGTTTTSSAGGRLSSSGCRPQDVGFLTGLLPITLNLIYISRLHHRSPAGLKGFRGLVEIRDYQLLGELMQELGHGS